ncbi:site-specific integrase [Halostagnicola sp. A56]|uniref:site-specific integrase n=1 Tax=Halostagnicola sp. A56 TaxID=1495067 RepID=UPI002101A8D6|nr:site-specific integrase [Halostagnicola sp. A56]
MRETPADRASYTPNDKSTVKSRKSKEDLHYLKPEQVDTMAQESGKLRDELIIRLLFQTGLRVSELIGIELSDIDQNNRSINVRGKGRKNRTVYYQPSLSLWTIHLELYTLVARHELNIDSINSSHRL